MKKTTYLISMVLAFMCQGASAEDYRYLPLEGSPDQSQTPWRFAGSKKAITVEDSGLNVELKDNDTLFWCIGKRGDLEQGEASAWNLNEEGIATVTFKLKVNASDTEVNCFTLMAGGNKGLAIVNFYPDKITAGGSGKKSIEHDCRTDDTYRLTIKSGKYSLISKRDGIIFEGLDSSGETSWNLLWIGSTYPFGDKPEEGKKCQRSWNLGFIRWTNKEAIFDAPEGN